MTTAGQFTTNYIKYRVQVFHSDFSDLTFMDRVVMTLVTLQHDRKKVHDSSFTSSSSCHLSYLPCSPAALNPSPIISDISLIRLSGADSPFSPPHPYVSAHVEQYLRSVHGGSALSMMSAARGLTPAQCKFGQLLVM